MELTPCEQCFIDALKHGAAANAQDFAGKTRLFRWTEYGMKTDVAVVEFLIDHGIDVNIKDIDGLTAYDWTHIRGMGNGYCMEVSPTHPEIQAVLIKAGSQPRKLPGSFKCRWGIN